MRLTEWVLMIMVGIAMCFFAYSSGFYTNEFISTLHGGTLVIVVVAVANSLIFGYTICSMIKVVRGRMISG